MTERQALLGAGALHLLLFAALSLGWTALPVPPPPEEAVAVELVSVAPRTQVTERPPHSQAAAPQETAAPPPQPDPVPLPTPPAPAPAPTPEPAAKPQPVEPKPAETKPAAKPRSVKVQAEPVDKPPERLDTAELSDLIDKSLPKAPKKVRDPDAFAKAIALQIPKSARLDTRATASLAAAIRAQIAPCWNPPIGGADVRRMTVVLSIQAAKDGSIVGRPSVVSQTGATSGNAAYAKAFADTAVRAVLRCAPLKLPPEMYDAWKAFELNFDPSAMA